MLVNVITRYPRRATTLLEQALAENANAFGGHSIAGTTRYLLPAIVQSGEAFGNNVVGFAPKILEQTRVQNAAAFGALRIEHLAPGIRHLVAPKVVNTSPFGAAQVRISRRYLVSARVANANQFGAADVHFAIRLLTQSKVTNANQFGAPTIAAVAATAVSVIIPSDADTTFVNSDGAARSTMAGGALVNLDG